MKHINKKIVFILVLVAVVALGSFVLFKNRKEIYINAVLTTKAYDYLPNEAKDYIKETYEKTGNVVLTEKNKEENKLYLNPTYVEYLTSSKQEQEDSEIIPQALVVDYVKVDTSTTYDEIPAIYDLRNDEGNYVTPVKDQGDLGICWSFATAGAVESYVLKTNHTSYDDTINPPEVSTRQLDYATATDSLVDYRSEYTIMGLRKLGGGGNFNIASLALANGVSSFYADSFKAYDDSDLQRMELREVLNYNFAKQELNFTTNMPRLTLRESTDGLSASEQATRQQYLNTIKQKILNTGAAYVSTYMNPKCFVPANDSEIDVLDVYNCEAKNPHAMQIIGWNDDFEYEYCADTKQHTSDVDNCIRTVRGTGVWILKNSWGSNYDYPYLAYDSMYSDISTIDNMQAKTDQNKWTWDNNYVMGSGQEGLTHKVFRLEELDNLKTTERLRKVKLFVSAPGNYQIKVQKAGGGYVTYTEHASQPGLVTYTYTSNINIDSTSQIEITSPGFIDQLSIFTTNLDSDKSVDTSEYDGIDISDSSFRFYSQTRNIEANAYLTYKIYNSTDYDVSTQITVSNNRVAENNINTLFSGLDTMPADTYRVDILYNNVTLVGQFYFNIAKMAGNGTSANPYVITNPSQLSQIRNNLSANYVLGNDIDLTEATGEGGRLSKQSSLCPQGFGWEAINGFSGTLDGQGHKIIGLRQDNYISCNEENGTIVKEKNTSGNGLFYKARGNVTIKNLTLENADLNCQNEFCGVLISNYVANFNDQGVTNYNDTTPYSAIFQNIAVKNSRIYRKSGIGSSNVMGSGLFGALQNTYGTIDVSNIYIDMDVAEDMSEKSYLANYIQGRPATVKNIYVQGRYNPSASNIAVIYEAQAEGSASISVNNIISTLTKETLQGTIINYVRGSNYSVDNIKMINANNKPVCGNINCVTNATDVTIYDSDSQLAELSKLDNYSSWNNFDNVWELKTIDNVKRIPKLKFMELEPTSLSNFTIDHELNTTYNIFDYITPVQESKDRLKFSSKNTAIFTIDNAGNITPQSYGNAYLHVESLYDGFIKDVIVQVNYQRHFTVEFKANGGEGIMDKVEVAIGDSLTLPECGFTKNGYSFKNWNTKANGSGKTYVDLGQVKSLTDKDVITLYAQWAGEEYEVTFDANGGTVDPRTKIVREGDTYGELPIPTRTGYGFLGWDGYNYGRVTSNTVLASTQLVADWREDAYTIIYDGNGGSIDIMLEDLENYNTMTNSVIVDTGTYEDPPELPNCQFIKNGFTLKEWNTKANGTGTSYQPEDILSTSSVKNGSVRLYAIWEKEAKYVLLSREKLYMTPEQLVTISAIIDPLVSNQYGLSDVEWESENEDVAEVENGTIRANGEGETIIHASLPVGLESTIELTVTNSTRPVMKGDIDLDDDVDAQDIILTLKKIFGYIPKDSVDIEITDVTGDNGIEVDDLIILIKYVFRYINSL